VYCALRCTFTVLFFFLSSLSLSLSLSLCLVRIKVSHSKVLARVRGQKKMSQVLDAFRLLDFTMLRPVLAWRAFWNLWTIHFFNFPFWGCRGKPWINETADLRKENLIFWMKWQLLPPVQINMLVTTGRDFPTEVEWIISCTALSSTILQVHAKLAPLSTVHTQHTAFFTVYNVHKPNTLFIFSGTAAQRGLWPPSSRGFLITHNDASQSVGLLWTSDHVVAETSTRQHTHASIGIRTHVRSRRAAVDLRLRPRPIGTGKSNTVFF
jgi:hypothetical protein